MFCFGLVVAQVRLPPQENNLRRRRRGGGSSFLANSSQYFLCCSLKGRLACSNCSGAVLGGGLEHCLEAVRVHSEGLAVEAIAVNLIQGLACLAFFAVGLEAGNALGVGGERWVVHAGGGERKWEVFPLQTFCVK